MTMTMLPVAIIVGPDDPHDVETAKRFNPLRVYGYYIPLAVWCLAKRVPGTLLVIAKFFRYLFLLIHSDIRLLCGLDATIGAMVGYFAGNALIGALVGGVWGVLNYEILSKRVLGLVPSRQ